VSLEEPPAWIAIEELDQAQTDAREVGVIKYQCATRPQT
jgi:hypothetical protein